MMSSRTLSICSDLLILLFLIMVSPVLGDTLPGPTYWDSVFELGFDPGTGRSSDDLACRRIEMVYDFSQLVSNHVQADQALSATYRDLRSMLSSLDAGNLYDLLPYTDTAGQGRAIGISGRSRGNSYRLNEYDPGVGKQLTLRVNAGGGASDGLQRFGDMDFRTFIRPIAKNKYRFMTDLQIFTDDLSAVIIPRMVSAGLTIAWHHAARSNDPPERLARMFQLMGMVEFDSAEDLFILQCRVLRGLLLPLNGSWTAGSSIGINLTDQALTQLYAEFDIHLNMVGLHLDVWSLQVPIDYQLNGGDLRLEACLRQPPDMVQADGRVFGFLPLWLIDMLIPSNVEKITRDFFQALATGNDGQGAIVEFVGLQRAPLKNSWLICADAEALSNGTIQLGFNLQRRFAREQQKLITELKAFNEQLWNAFYRDYQKVKHERGCQ